MRKEDPRLDLLLGRTALERGLLAEAQLREALSLRALSVKRGRKTPRPLGAILAEKKWLTDAQVLELSAEIEGRMQKEDEGRRKDAFLGQILIDADFVAPGHVEECLYDQAERWKEGETPLPRLGELLVRKGYATKEEVDQALALQRSLAQVCSACGKETVEGDRCPSCGGAFKARMDSGVFSAPPKAKAPAAPADAAAFGRYTLRSTVEKSGGVTVYDAQDVELDRRVTLRVLDQAGTEAQARARDAAGLKHAHLAAIFEAGVHGGRAFVAVERVEGPSLGDAWAEGSLKLRQSVRILRDVALAIHHAHGRGLTHGRLQPESVRLDAQGRGRVVDLWGATEAPAYLSPERARGDREVGPAADVWSLGALLYAALAGRAPFQGADREGTLSKIMCEAPEPPSAVAPASAGRALNRPLETLCLSALEKKAARRPSSAEAFAETLSAWLKGAPEAAPAPRRKFKPPAKWIAIAAGALLALAGLIAGVGLATGESRDDRTLRKAGEYLAAGQADAALQLYERVLSREPRNERARLGREAARARLEAEEAKARLEDANVKISRD